MQCFDSTDGYTPNEDSQYLKYLPSVSCETDRFRTYRWGIIIPGIVLWVQYLPLLLFTLIHVKLTYIYSPPADDTEKVQKSRVRNTKYFYGFYIMGLKNGLTNLLEPEEKV